MDCFVAPLLAMTVACSLYYGNDGTQISGRDLGQHRVECHRSARQILEGLSAIGRLLLRFGRGRTNLGHRLAAIEQGSRRNQMKFMGLNRLVLEQEDAERDDVLAAPI